MKKIKKKHIEHTTFDPKIHYRKKGFSGYGLKVDAKVDRSGAQLAHLLNPK